MINKNTFSVLKENAHLLKNNLHGIEREALRVDEHGVIAQTPHPVGLGSALTHPYITTDYSEALLEFVTPTFKSIDDCLTFMRQIHQFTMENMHEKEFLWMSSMPCITPSSDSIPIAKYGTSNVAKMKEIYRRGLGIRYGRPMQTISGIHYNFSFSDELMALISQQQKQSSSDSYLGLTRNFRRHAWSLIYFLGASPALCKSFICEKQREDLDVHKDTTLYLPYATSLRMSDLGYQNDAQSLLPISLNSLDEYIKSLQSATSTNYPPYEKFGLKDGDKYHQLSTNILQIENEYYAPIRPKQPIKSGEKPSTAIAKRGIAYVEVRCIDVNPFSEMGISKVQTKLVDLLLTYCLICDSPRIEEDEFKIIQDNIANVARQGRNPDLTLQSADGGCLPIRESLHSLLDSLEEIANLYDAHILPNDDTFLSYKDTINYYRDALENRQTLPSEKILNYIFDNQLSYIDFAKLMSLKHRNTLASSKPIGEDFRAELNALAVQSIEEQQSIEANDNVDFDTYLKKYQQEQLNH